MPDFHQTGYGRDFFSHQLPELIKSINRLSEAIETQNKLSNPPTAFTDYLVGFESTEGTRRVNRQMGVRFDTEEMESMSVAEIYRHAAKKLNIDPKRITSIERQF